MKHVLVGATGVADGAHNFAFARPWPLTAPLGGVRRHSEETKSSRSQVWADTYSPR
jgi:hypothetical protein